MVYKLSTKTDQWNNNLYSKDFLLNFALAHILNNPFKSNLIPDVICYYFIILSGDIFV